MKTLFSRSIVLCLALFISQSLHAQWVEANGPYGARTFALTVSGSTLYTGTYGTGVYTSTNDGATWTSICTGTGPGDETMHAADIQALNVHNGTILAGLDQSSSGLYRSTNGGTSWTATSITHYTRAIIRLDTIVFAGTDIGVFRSTDDGVTWDTTNTGLTNPNVFSFATLGPFLFAGTSRGDLFRSSDSGATWVSVSIGLPVNADPHTLAVIGSEIYAGVGVGIYASTDSGSSWTSLLSLSRPRAMSVLGGTLFVGSESGGVWRTTNNGATWTQVDTGLVSLDVESFTVRGTNIFAGTGVGVFKSTNNGSSWSNVNAGIFPNRVIAFLRLDSFLFSGTSSGIFKSTNGGIDWTISSNGISTSNEINALAIKDSTLWAGSGGGAIYKSTDKGDSWSTSLSCRAISLLVHGSQIYVGRDDGQISLSTDDGATWNDVSPPGIPGNGRVQSFAEIGINVFAAVAGTGVDGVYRTTDDGAHWMSVSTGLPASKMQALIVKDSTLFVGTFVGNYRSTNKGDTWIEVDQGFRSNDKDITCLALHDSLLFTGGGGGVYRTTNNGDVWNRVSPELSGVYVWGLIVYDTTLVAGLGRTGVWRRPNSEFFKEYIGGTLWKDRNYDGGRSSFDSAIVGRTVKLTGDLNLETVTDSNGRYLFQNLPPGNYTVSESLPDCWVQTVPPIFWNLFPTYSVGLLGGEGFSNFDFGSGPSSCYQGPSGGDLFNPANYNPGEAPTDSGSVTLSKSAVVSHLPGQSPGASRTGSGTAAAQFTLGVLHIKNGGAVQFNPNVGTLQVTTVVQLDTGSSMTFPSTGTNEMLCSGSWISHGALDLGNSRIEFSGRNRSIILEPPATATSTARTSVSLSQDGFYDMDLTGDSTSLTGNLKVRQSYLQKVCKYLIATSG